MEQETKQVRVMCHEDGFNNLKLWLDAISSHSDKTLENPLNNTTVCAKSRDLCYFGWDLDKEEGKAFEECSYDFHTALRITADNGFSVAIYKTIFEKDNDNSEFKFGYIDCDGCFTEANCPFPVLSVDKDGMFNEDWIIDMVQKNSEKDSNITEKCGNPQKSVMDNKNIDDVEK